MDLFKKLVKNRRTVFAFAAMSVGVLCVVLTCYVILANLGSMSGFVNSVTAVLSPIIIGLVLAYIIDPVAKFFEDKVLKKMKKEGARRALSTAIALVLVLALLLTFVSMLIPSLISSIKMLIDNSPAYYASAEQVVDKINSLGFGLHIDLSAIEVSVRNWLGNIANNLTENLGSILNTTKDIGATAVNILLGVILAIYILFSKKYMLTGLRRLRKALFTPKKYESSTKFWNRCHEIFIQYIGCNVIDALLIGVATAVFMLILGMPYVPLVAFVVGLANLIPTFGPIIGAVIGALVLVLVKPAFALWFLLFTIGIQMLDAYLIKPRLFSSSFGIAAVWTLISITVGGNLFGILGVLLAIPVAAILTFIYDERLIPWLEKMSAARAARAEELARDESDTAVSDAGKSEE